MKCEFLAAAALAGLIAASPAAAQHGAHGAAQHPGAEHGSAPPAAPKDEQGPEPMQHESGPHAMTAEPTAPAATSDTAAGQVGHQDHAAMDHGGGVASGMMDSPLGAYPMSRDASGTAWQPDASAHQGLHATAGPWMLMSHALLNGVYDWQQGPRGNEKLFLSGMAMGAARRDLGAGSTLQFRAMLSPDPLMGKSGYPLLLAAGETANGATPLVDRQHPHDFFMELSARYSLRLVNGTSLFVYGGLPGEPAFGPPAFMHRLSILDSPEAPITHHWLDSTHIAFGVVTAGLVRGKVKVEASRFNGREPDQHRWNIETGPLDSTALRLSWNPTSRLSLQGSWGHFVSPEQLEPGERQTRWSASLLHTLPLGAAGYWSTSLAWGRRSSDHQQLDAVLLESALRRGSWTFFGRGEWTENDELSFVGGHHGPAYRVAKISIGAVRDFRLADHLAIGAGALASINRLPAGLEPSYGGSPKGVMAFLRIKVE